MSKISVVIPVGNFPYFIYACLGNIYGTAGPSLKDLDIVLLVPQDAPAPIFEHLEIAKQSYQFRMIIAPINLSSKETGRTGCETINHLKLLDWVFYNSDLSEWVLIQHSDLFYDPSRIGWADHFLRMIRPNMFCFYKYGHSPIYHVDRNPVPVLHDYIGLFNRDFLVRERLSFNWGYLYETLFPSEATTTAIENGRISQNGLIGKGSWIDGTKGMSLEAAIRFPDRMEPFNWPVYHISAFFKVAHSIRRVGSTVNIEGTVDVEGPPCQPQVIRRYAHIVSRCFDKTLYKDYILPVGAFRNKSMGHDEDWINYICSFAKDVDSVGPTDNFGVDQINFAGNIL